MKTARAIILGGLMLIAAQALGQMSATAKPGQAVLLEPVALTIQSSGGQKGSATFPKGRHVQVVETSGHKSKISVANLAEGWVDNSILELIAHDTAPTPTAVAAGEDAHDAQAGGEQTTNIAAVEAAVKLKKPYVRTKIDVQEGEIVKPEGGGCYDQKITYNYKVILSGITPQEQELYKANVLILVEERWGRRFGDKEQEFRMIPLKELHDANNSFNYYHTKWGCRCCKELNPTIVGHAVLVRDMQGNVITTYKTEMRKKEQEFLEENLGYSL